MAESVLRRSAIAGRLCGGTAQISDAHHNKACWLRSRSPERIAEAKVRSAARGPRCRARHSVRARNTISIRLGCDGIGLYSRFSFRRCSLSGGLGFEARQLE